MSTAFVPSVFPGRVCPKCRGRKAYYAKACRGCSVSSKPLAGRCGADHPVANGVPLPLGRVVAKAVRRAMGYELAEATG